MPVIEASPNQMRQLFQNLLGKALKYHGGRETRHQSLGETGR